MAMGIVVYEENRKGDLIYNFNDYDGKTLFLIIEELELMGPAVPRTGARTDHRPFYRAWLYSGSFPGDTVPFVQYFSHFANFFSKCRLPVMRL